MLEGAYTEYKHGVQNNIDNGSGCLADHAVDRPAGGLEQAFKAELPVEAKRQTKTDSRVTCPVTHNLFVFGQGQEEGAGEQQPDQREHHGAARIEKDTGIGGLVRNILFLFAKGTGEQRVHAHAGTAARTAERDNFLFNGTKMDAQAFWTNAPAEEFIYDASFLKLGEASIGYNFSPKFLERTTAGIVKTAKVSVYGSNLLYLIKHTPGTTPDGSSTDISIFASAFDMCPYPSTRNFGASITIGF